MSSFKFGNDLETFDEQQAKKNDKKNRSIIVVVIVALIIGVLSFFISNAILGGSKDDDDNKIVEVSIDDENVQILYQYVTYGVRGTRGDKFLKEKNVSLNSFSNYERFYYALQFVEKNDFKYTGKLDSNKNKIYNISSDKIREYMQLFFGNNISYSSASEITHIFDFKMDGKNVGVLKYSEVDDGFNVVFTGVKDNIEKNVVEPYYYKLYKAEKYSDQTLILEEKVVYTKHVLNNGYYDVNIYSDFGYTKLLDQKNKVTKNDLIRNPIKVDDYIDRASTIRYKFSVNNSVYFFDSSEIIEK